MLTRLVKHAHKKTCEAKNFINGTKQQYFLHGCKGGATALATQAHNDNNQNDYNANTSCSACNSGERDSA